MTPDYQGLAAVALAATLVPLIVGLALYAWYGFALSRLFPKLGAEAWRGWVPVLNEIEILVRGGVPGWSVVFYFIPVVQLYGIYLKALAVHRINESFGRGAGFTVLGILLPPLWATLLASGRMPAEGAYDRRVEGLMSASGAAPAQEPAADALGVAPVYATEPPPPPADPVRMAFPAFAASPEPPRTDPVPLDRPPFDPPAVAAPVLTPPAFTAPPFVPEPPRAEPRPELTRPEPPREEPPAAAPFAWSQAPEPAQTPPDAEPDLEATITTAGRRAAVEDDDDEADRTVVVDRRPRVPWRLLTDEGHVIPLRTRVVVLGRKPGPAGDGIAVIAVPDSTKTLSKSHARLELSDDGEWTVHDLDSTNGVIIIEPDGTETLLPQGGSAPVPGRFVLGKVGMRVSVEEEAP